MVISNVKIERVKKGLTQQVLADLTIGIVSQVVVSQIEHGRRPRADEAAALAHVLGVPVAALFPPEPKPPVVSKAYSQDTHICLGE